MPASMPQFPNFGQSSIANFPSTPSMVAPTGFNFDRYNPQIPVNGASVNMPRAARPNRRGAANTSQKQNHATSVDPQLIAAASQALGDVTVKMNNLGNALIGLNASMINTVDYLNKLSAAAGGTPAPAPDLAPAPIANGPHHTASASQRTASAGPCPLAPAPPRPPAPTVSGPVASTAPMTRASSSTLPQKPNPKKRPHPDSAAATATANPNPTPIASVGTFTTLSSSSHPHKALKRSVQAFAGSSPLWLPEEKQWLRDQARRYKGVVPRPSNKQLAKEFNDHWVGRSVAIKYTTQDGETHELASLPREARSERAVETAARRYRLWDDIMVSNLGHGRKKKEEEEQKKKCALESAEKGDDGGAEEGVAGDGVAGGEKVKDKAGGGKKD